MKYFNSKRTYLDLCIREVTGNIEKTEKDRLDIWLNKSDLHKNEYEKIKEIWQASELKSNPPLPDIEANWNEMNNRLNITETNQLNSKILLKQNKNVFESLFIPKWKPALGITAILAFLIISLVFFINKNPYLEETIYTSTTNKEQKQIQLSDGSLIRLNSASSIKYPKQFDKTLRQVYLSGEAFFSVNKDKRPFVIITSNAKTTVLGTKFNIWAHDGKTKIIVKEGRVSFSQIKTNNSKVYLSQNQTSTIINDSKPSKPQNINAGYLLGWMEGKLVFDATPLEEAINELQWSYNTKILVTDDKIRNQLLTGSFTNTEIDSVISMICLALDLNYYKQNDQYIIKSGSLK